MTPDIAPPSIKLLVGESRAAWAYGRYLLRGLEHKKLPLGKRQPVIVLPGFGASDRSTRPLRMALGKLGYSVYGWAQGTNLGMNSKRKNLLVTQLQEIGARHQQPVALVGWSLGGVFARELARAFPDLVSQVFTLGSPINGDPDANNVSTLFSWFNPNRPPTDRDAFNQRIAAPPVPCTAIFTREDGIVAWQCSQEESGPMTENVEVQGTHVGLPWNPQVLAAIAERLPRSPLPGDLP
ncbi:alpha/beta hydrolase [Alcanivorax sp.]|jgi:pimeloyl-ACP methyl ester carboxylesterase|uniref:esterase/lipase family protein n=1 Tax=Alcanivorax sp. TaxID=1872427 RepID=UPI0032D94D57